MSEQDTNRLKKVSAELREANDTLAHAKKSLKKASSHREIEDAVESIKTVKRDVAQLEGEQSTLLLKLAL